MKINNAKDLGIAIRTKRKGNGYTQKYLSEVTGLSVSFISELECGKETAELGKALRLANILGLDIWAEKR